MSAFPPRFFLREGERVLVEERISPSWTLEHAARTLVLATAIWGGLFLWVGIRQPANEQLYRSLLIAAFVAHIVLMLLYLWRRVVTTEYVLTDEAVYARRGRFLLSVTASALDRVTDLHVHTSLFGRLLGFSGLTVLTAGGGVSFRGLRDAYRIRSLIQEARHSLIARLLRESGVEASPSSEVAPCQCPRCQTVFSVATVRPVDVTCPQCGTSGMLFEEVPA